jgi:hypothetical protein
MSGKSGDVTGKSFQLKSGRWPSVKIKHHPDQEEEKHRGTRHPRTKKTSWREKMKDEEEGEE